MSRRPKIARCLVAEIRYVSSSKLYRVEVLQADSANLATKTGIGSTLLISPTVIKEALAMYGLKSARQLVGAPMQCTVNFDTCNVLGNNSFDRFVY